MTSSGDTLTHLAGAGADLKGTFHNQKLRVDERIAYIKACMTAMTKVMC